MDRNELLELRTNLAATQAQMASAMGIPLRTYQDIEAGISKFRPAHETMAHMASIRLAAANHKPEAIPEEVMRLLRLVAAMGR